MQLSMLSCWLCSSAAETGSSSGRGARAQASMTGELPLGGATLLRVRPGKSGMRSAQAGFGLPVHCIVGLVPAGAPAAVRAESGSSMQAFDDITVLDLTQ